MKLIKKYWFFIGIAAMVAAAFAAPSAGDFFHEHNILSIGIFLAFLATGLTLETSSLAAQLKQVKVLAAALTSSLVLIPIIAYYGALQLFPDWPEFAVGALIIGTAPVTVASGTVMTAIAGGNVPLSLFICVLCNFASIITIPIMLKLILHFGEGGVKLPVVKMFFSLTLKVVLPIVIGQVLRIWVKDLIKKLGKPFSIFNQCIVLLIIFNAVSSSTGKIIQAGSVLVYVFGFMIFLHILILMMNMGISRMLKLDLPSTAAFTIHTSQKTLTISYLVWAGFFATAFPMALIPGIAYHLTQMIMDSFVAQIFWHKISRAKA